MYVFKASLLLGLLLKHCQPHLITIYIAAVSVDLFCFHIYMYLFLFICSF